MADRTMKLLLLAIAVGLWMNVVASWTQAVPVEARSEVAEQAGSWEDTSFIYLASDFNFRRAVQRVVERRCSVSSRGQISC